MMSSSFLEAVHRSSSPWTNVQGGGNPPDKTGWRSQCILYIIQERRYYDKDQENQDPSDSDVDSMGDPFSEDAFFEEVVVVILQTWCTPQT